MSRPGGAGGAPGGPLQEGRGEGGRRSTATQPDSDPEDLPLLLRGTLFLLLGLGSIPAIIFRRLLRRGPAKVFHAQILITGKTCGAEEKFLEKVSKLLSCQGVSLTVKEFTETSKDPVLVFCPIASTMANNTENALKGLSGDQKAILVVMHYVPKDSTRPIADMWQRQTHPALVQVVHTRYTLQDGFYPCEMNEVAMNEVAAAIKMLHTHP